MKLELVDLYREVRKHETGTDDYTFEGAYVKKGHVLELSQLTLTDITTGNKALLIGYEDGKGEYHWFRMNDSANIYSVWMNGRAFLHENERPVGQVQSPSDGDEVHFSAMGRVYRIVEE